MMSTKIVGFITFSFLLLSTNSLKAVDLLYVSLGESDVVTYDVSLSSASAIANSMTNFVTGVTWPRGIAVDSSNNVYVASNINSTVSKYNSSGLLLNNFNTDRPNGLALDSLGNIYVDGGISSTYLTKLSPAGSQLLNISLTGGPAGITVNSSGIIYVANYLNNSIQKFNQNGTELSPITSNLLSPISLGVDSIGNLYVTNEVANNVSKFDSSGNFITTIGSSSNLSSPFGISFDKFDNMYVSNYSGKSISKFDSSGNFQYSWSTGTSVPYFMAMAPVTVPEPSTYAMGLLATGFLAAIARRRKTRRG